MRTYFRFLWRNKLYSAINLAGLTVSLAFSVMIFSHAAGQLRISRSNPDRKDIYAVSYDNSAIMCYGMADILRNSIPEAVEVTRFSAPSDGDAIAGYGDRKYTVSLMTADKAFFSMFKMEMKEGNADLPEGGSNVLISESFAEKIAGNGESLVGKTIMIEDGPFTVTGIFEDTGKDIIPYTDIIADISDDRFIGQYKKYPYNTFGAIQTFIRVNPGTDMTSLAEKVDREFAKALSAAGGQETEEDSFGFIRLDRLYFHHGNIFLNKGNSKALKNLTLAGIALLLSALFNYINLSTALAGKRAKEMATRRLLGSTRREIILRYIQESFIFTSICFISGILLAVVLVPTVSRLITDPAFESQTAGMSVDDMFTAGAILSYIALVVLISVISGLLPAMTASGFTPIDIVKGSLRMRGKMVFSKIFIVVQNALSIILMTMAIVMECQMKHMLERPSGCNLDDILYLSTDFSDNDAMRFLDKLRALPCVKSAGTCQSIPGAIGSSYGNPDKDGNEAIYWFMKCDSSTFNMLGFEIVEQYGESIPGAVWLSECAAATSGTDHAHTDLSTTVSYDYEDANTATGIVKDFIIMDAGYSEKTENGIIFIVRPEELWNLSYAIKTEGDHAQARRMITECYEDHCREVFGTTVPAWINDYMTDYLENSLEGARRNMKMVEMFMILAIVLSLSGLVAISIFYADGNRKSIALHKVYGGTYGSEMLRNIRTYMVMALIAAAISIPVSVILSERYLQEFAWRIDSYGWIFAVTALLSLLFTAASVIWQVSRAARTDPAEALRTE